MDNINNYKLLGKEPIYALQYECGHKIASYWLEGVRKIILAAMTQSGKTAAFMEAVFQFRLFAPDCLVLFLCHKSNTSIAFQGKRRATNAFNHIEDENLVVTPEMVDRIDLGGKVMCITPTDVTTKKSKGKLIDSIRKFRASDRPIVLVLDESHYGTSYEGKIPQTLADVFGADLRKHYLEWENQNLYIASVSATPNQEVLSEQVSKKSEIVLLGTTDAYFGVSEVLDSSNFTDTDNIKYYSDCGKKVSPWYRGEMAKIMQKEPGYIFHRETSLEKYRVLREEWEGMGADVLACGTVSAKTNFVPRQQRVTPVGVADPEEGLLNHKPTKHTVILLDLAFSAGDTLEDKYLIADFAKRKCPNGETYTQRCRWTGYNKNRETLIYASATLLKEAKTAYESYKNENVNQIEVQSGTYNTNSFKLEQNYRFVLHNSMEDDSGKVLACRSVSSNKKNDLALAMKNRSWRSSQDSCVKIDGPNKNHLDSWNALQQQIRDGKWELSNGKTATVQDLRSGWCFVRVLETNEKVIVEKEARFKSGALYGA